MTYGLVELGNGEEPVSFTTFKDQIGIVLETDKPHATRMLKAAREYVEARTGRCFGARQLLLSLPCFPCHIELPRSPVISVDIVAYYDEDGTPQTLTDYQAALNREPAVIAPARDEVWPTIDPYTLHPVRITFTAGYTDVPARAEEAIVLLAAHWYKNHEAASEVRQTKIPYGVESLIRNLKWKPYV